MLNLTQMSRRRASKKYFHQSVHILIKACYCSPFKIFIYLMAVKLHLPCGFICIMNRIGYHFVTLLIVFSHLSYINDRSCFLAHVFIDVELTESKVHTSQVYNSINFYTHICHVTKPCIFKI